MIIPRYWAEGRVQYRKAGKQVTVRRFGWSDDSEELAQLNADERARDALARILSGEKLKRRELKVPYNGADGVPIREEIVDRRGEVVITRNSYGALCLNTPDVFFADVDFQEKHLPCAFTVVVVVVAVGCLVMTKFGSDAKFWLAIMVAALFSGPLVIWSRRAWVKASGGHEKVARNRLRAFIRKNPTWNLRVYRTPAGLRVMATHRLFSSDEPAVVECFKFISTDPMYQRMCLKQRCFRARVSPKPWRIGIGDHMKPRPGTWPVKPVHLPLRIAWIQHYENTATSFAACRFLESLGSGLVAEEVLPVVQWHDELSKSDSFLKIA